MFTNTFDLIPDQFISYDEDITVKQEKLSDPDVSLPTHFSLTSESTPFYPSFFPPSLRNMLESADLTIRDSIVVPDSANLKRRKPFKIVRTKKEEEHESTIEVKIEPEKKLINNSRREYRREVAKKKTQKKMEAKNFSFTPKLSLSPDDLENLSLEDKTGRKMLQMIRNRISAQNSRDRRKAYVNTLENSKDVLYQENLGLSVEKSKLLEEMQRLKETNARLLQEREQFLKKQGQSSESERSTESGMEQLKIDNYLNKLDMKPKQGMGMAFSLGLLLSVSMMMQINEQNMLKLNTCKGHEQAKLAHKGEESLLMELGKECMLPLRKCSQMTAASSQGSPLIFAKPLASTPYDTDLSNTMAYNDGTDDGWVSLDHDTSPLTDNKEDFSNVYRVQIESGLHNKDFGMGGKDLMVNMKDTLGQFKSMRSQDNKTGHLLDFSLLN